MTAVVVWPVIIPCYSKVDVASVLCCWYENVYSVCFCLCSYLLFVHFFFCSMVHYVSVLQNSILQYYYYILRQASVLQRIWLSCFFVIEEDPRHSIPKRLLFLSMVYPFVVKHRKRFVWQESFSKKNLSYFNNKYREHMAAALKISRTTVSNVIMEKCNVIEDGPSKSSTLGKNRLREFPVIG